MTRIERHAGPAAAPLIAALSCICLTVAACDDASTDDSHSPDRSVRSSRVDGTSRHSVRGSRRPDSFADAVEKVRPAVVNLYTARDSAGEDQSPSDRSPSTGTNDAYRRLVPEDRLGRSLGSGLVVDSDGLVVTNYHVVEDTDDVRARLLDGRWFETKQVGYDPNTDIALIRLLDAGDVPTSSLGDSSTLKVGDWVVAIGNPLGLSSTVTVGIASGIGRSNLPLGGRMRYQDFIQTDASINPGNSGGPLVDAHGRVVGLNTAITARGHGIGFAIPSAMVERLIPRLERGGRVRRSWVGLYVDEAPGPLRRELDVGDQRGVLVTGITEDGPADRADLRKGDVIVALDGEPIHDVGQINWLAGNLPIDEDVSVTVQRGDQRKTLTLTPDAAPDAGR